MPVGRSNFINNINDNYGLKLVLKIFLSGKICSHPFQNSRSGPGDLRTFFSQPKSCFFPRRKVTQGERERERERERKKEEEKKTPLIVDT